MISPLTHKLITKQVSSKQCNIKAKVKINVKKSLHTMKRKRFGFWTCGRPEGANHIPWNYLKAVFHRIYLVHSWILWSLQKCFGDSESNHVAILTNFAPDPFKDFLKPGALGLSFFLATLKCFKNALRMPLRNFHNIFWRFANYLAGIHLFKVNSGRT